MPTITRLSPDCTARCHDELADLLQSCVNNGASVGFFAPLQPLQAKSYWQETIADMVNGKRWIWIARVNGRIVGSVQIAVCEKPNGLHRAEIQKLLVHLAFRRQGIATALLTALEQEALAAGRELLVLDTSTGDRAESLYRRMGYCEAGLIPGYTRTPYGEAHSTSIYYKHLHGQPAPAASADNTVAA